MSNNPHQQAIKEMVYNFLVENPGYVHTTSGQMSFVDKLNIILTTYHNTYTRALLEEVVGMQTYKMFDGHDLILISREDLTQHLQEQIID